MLSNMLLYTHVSNIVYGNTYPYPLLNPAPDSKLFSRFPPRPPSPSQALPPCKHTLAVHRHRMAVYICSGLLSTQANEDPHSRQCKNISKELFSLSEGH